MQIEPNNYKIVHTRNRQSTTNLAGSRMYEMCHNIYLDWEEERCGYTVWSDRSTQHGGDSGNEASLGSPVISPVSRTVAICGKYSAVSGTSTHMLHPDQLSQSILSENVCSTKKPSEPSWSGFTLPVFNWDFSFYIYTEQEYNAMSGSK